VAPRGKSLLIELTAIETMALGPLGLPLPPPLLQPASRALARIHPDTRRI
jgi:hypothetical protein